jgi:hypothetical protein
LFDMEKHQIILAAVSGCAGSIGVQPQGNVINKLADTLGTSIDFLISGGKDEKVKASLKDAELLQQFKAVEQFTDDDKAVVKKLIDAFIIKKQLQQMAS